MPRAITSVHAKRPEIRKENLYLIGLQEPMDKLKFFISFKTVKGIHLKCILVT